MLRTMCRHDDSVGPTEACSRRRPATAGRSLPKVGWDIISPPAMRASSAPTNIMTPAGGLLTRLRALALAAIPAGAALGAGAAQAQQIPGVALPGIPSTAMDIGERGAAFGNDGAAVAGARGAASMDASMLLALPAPTALPTLTLADVLDAAARDAADVKVAAERVLQQEAALRRAWAAILPQVTLGGVWTLTCLGGTSGINCADRTTQFADPKQLEQQATLFESIAGLLDIAASAPGTTPQQADNLLGQSAQLKQGAEQTRSAASNVRPVVVQPSNVFNAQLSVSLPLFQGRAIPLLQNAEDGVRLAERARAQVRNALLYSATRAYHSAVAAQKLVAIAGRQHESAERHREATRARVEAQTQPPLALKRAELEELRARQQLESANAAADLAIASLGLLVGRTEGFAVTDPDEPPAAVVDLPADELVTRALDARPDVAAQRLALEMARRSEVDAWMMFLPSVNVVGSARATSFTQGFVRDPITGTLSLTASLPLYDGGVRYAALRESASRIREETIRTRQLEDRVAAQVRGNSRDIDVKVRALALARETVVVARTAREQAEAMFQAGVGTSLDVSDTGLALFVAENDAARAELDLQLARAGLSWALGDPPTSR